VGSAAERQPARADRLPGATSGRIYDVDPDDVGLTILTIGDFNYFAIVDRAGMNVEFIPHLFGGSSRYPTGQRGAVLWWRNSSQVLSPTLQANSAFVSLKVLPIAMSTVRRGDAARRRASTRSMSRTVSTRDVHARDRSEMRQLLNFDEDSFVVGMVANNQGQSPFPEGFPVRRSSRSACSARSTPTPSFTCTLRCRGSGTA
jgi:hypothetical protein